MSADKTLTLIKNPKYTKVTGKFGRFSFTKDIRISFELIFKSREKRETLFSAIDFSYEL